MIRGLETERVMMPAGIRCVNQKRLRAGAFPALGIFLIVLVSLAGCMKVGPDYRKLPVAAPAEWHSELTGGLNNTAPDENSLARWWESLDDPQLSELEERAALGNLDLEQARARVREARAMRGVSKAGLFPTLDTFGRFSKLRESENFVQGERYDLYQAGFDATWELDVFGGQRRRIEAAQAELEASREDLRDVLVSLLAEVALNYVDVRLYQARLRTIRKNIAIQQENYDLNLARSRAGLIDKLSLEQSRYTLEYSRSQLPGLETGLEAAKNRLAVLVGETPGSLHDELAAVKPIPLPVSVVPVGIPATTLRRRPDVRRAERSLAAASARIGAVTAELFPKFYLGGTVGLEAIDNDKLWRWASRAWNLGPRVSWNIFDAGAIRQHIEATNARQEQALASYQNTLLKAQEEVENSLVAYVREQRRQASLAKAGRSAARALELAREQYKAGLVDFINVLEVQRSLLEIEDQLDQSRGRVTANLIRLYKSLGGGWQGYISPAPKR